MSRARRQLDPTRLAQLVQRPGTDPRTWVALGVLEEVAYDPAEGFVVAVRMVAGALVGEVVACELAHALAPEGALVSVPLRLGELAVCVVPEGDANAMPVVIGCLRAPEGAAPRAVNGRTIDAAALAELYVLADPARGAELALGPVRLTAPTLRLGPGPEPTQPFVRGQALAGALGAFLDALETFVTDAGTAVAELGAASTGPLAGLATPFAKLGTALTKFAPAIGKLKARLVTGDVLSEHITGE